MLNLENLTSETINIANLIVGEFILYLYLNKLSVFNKNIKETNTRSKFKTLIELICIGILTYFIFNLNLITIFFIVFGPLFLVSLLNL